MQNEKEIARNVINLPINNLILDSTASSADINEDNVLVYITGQELCAVDLAAQKTLFRKQLHDNKCKITILTRDIVVVYGFKETRRYFLHEDKSYSMYDQRDLLSYDKDYLLLGMSSYYKNLFLLDEHYYAHFAKFKTTFDNHLVSACRKYVCFWTIHSYPVGSSIIIYRLHGELLTKFDYKSQVLRKSIDIIDDVLVFATRNGKIYKIDLITLETKKYGIYKQFATQSLSDGTYLFPGRFIHRAEILPDRKHMLCDNTVLVNLSSGSVSPLPNGRLLWYGMKGQLMIIY